MNKKVVIGIIAGVVVAVIGVVVFLILSQSKVKPEDVWQSYIKLINEQKYEEMYAMLTQESKSQISKEDFIARNKNIYEGIEMSDMKSEITAVEEESSSIRKISYNIAMNTEAGSVNFTNTVRLTKDKEKGYLINWSSTLIFPQLNSTDKVRIKTISAQRGTIQDKNGMTLAGEGYVSSVGIVPGKLGENKDADIEKIAQLLGMTSESINKSLSASWVKDDVFVPLKKVSMDDTDLKKALLEIQGIKITSAKSRVYPLGEAAAHLVGYVQNITAEELEENKDKGYNSNSIIGKAGLERIYEERLKGTDGVEIYIEDAEGNRKTDIAKIDVQNGENIKLTIDSNMQTKLYNELKQDEGFFVVMHPKTGELLALVSTPSYNPNDFVIGMSTEKWNSIKNNEANPMLVRYLQSYCPGSTFKPITGAIGLTTGSLSENDTFTYSGTRWKKDGWGEYDITTLTEYDEPKNLRNALINSDNIYFAQATIQIGKSNFTNGLKKIKFGESIDFILSLAKSQYANNGEISNEKLLADSGYGQGQILVNPIHMASIYSAFANEGKMIKPYLEVKENNEVEYLVENAFTAEAANIIKDDMIQVVEVGTAKDMKVAGRTIAGKTGTAELKASKDAEADVLGWFNCFTTDSDENQLLVVSMVENGRDLGGSHYLIKKIKTLF
ncbi:MAG: penicillin-binding transpeptidase domain-containing protein [Clostridia bacterium]|nr:penicillin-binding transpeptidase domain-containing protein [Clostridia bacterium]